MSAVSFAKALYALSETSKKKKPVNSLLKNMTGGILTRPKSYAIREAALAPPKKKPLPKKAVVSQAPGTITSSYAQYNQKKKPLGKNIKDQITKVAGSTIRSKTLTTGRLTSSIGQIGYNETSRNFNAGDLIVLQNKLPAVLTTGKLFCKQVRNQTTFKNQTMSETKVEIYDLICKRDLPTTTVQHNIANLWQQGILDEGGASSDFVNYGSSPFDSNLIRESFRLVKKTIVNIPGGSTHVHTAFSQPHKWLEMDYITNQTSASDYVNLTTITWVVATGAPCNDITTKTQVSCAPVAIDWINVQEYIVQGLGTTKRVYSANSTSLPTAFTVGISLMDEDGDVVTSAGVAA